MATVVFGKTGYWFQAPINLSTAEIAESKRWRKKSRRVTRQAERHETAHDVPFP